MKTHRQVILLTLYSQRLFRQSMQFTELNLNERLQKKIADKGFSEPTAIQAAAIPLALDDKDIIACAKTGSGKTLGYLLPVLHRLIENPKETDKPRALVLAPTRELALQIKEEAAHLLEGSDDDVAAVFGGEDYSKQRAQLKKNPLMIIATPGRLMDFMKNNEIDLSEIEFGVLDEADRMLDMGFIDDVKKIFSKVKSQPRIYLFSATVDYHAIYSVWEFMDEPEEILINPELVDHDKIEQMLLHLGRDEKLQYLIQYIEESDDDPIIIFCNTKAYVEVVVENLRYHNIAAHGLSSVVSQNKRQRVLNDFKERKFRVLVATDVASRGLHIEDVDLVINFDIPQDPETYVHRIGRTARAGKTGKALSICSEFDYNDLSRLESYLTYKIPVHDPEEKYLENLGFIRLVRTRTDRSDNRDRKGRGAHKGGRSGRPDKQKGRDRKAGPGQKGGRKPGQKKHHKHVHRDRPPKFKDDSVKVNLEDIEVRQINVKKPSRRTIWQKIAGFFSKKPQKTEPQVSQQTLERLRREEEAHLNNKGNTGRSRKGGPQKNKSRKPRGSAGKRNH